MPDFGQRIAALDKTKPTYVYCRSGARSANAAGQLTTAGFAAGIEPARRRARLAGATGYQVTT